MGVAAAPWVGLSHKPSRVPHAVSRGWRGPRRAQRPPRPLRRAPKGAPRAVGDRGPRPRESSPRNYFRAATSTPPKRIRAPTNCPGVGTSPKMTTPATSVISGCTKRSTEPTTLGRCGMEALISG